MSLTAEDRVEIHELLALHGHLCDAGAYERFYEVFTPDLEVDAGALGRRPLPEGDPSRPRLDTYITAARRIGPSETLALHASNVIIREDGDDARAWSKGLTVKKDGSVASFTYVDQLVRTSQGWRIRRRKVSASQEPGSAVEPLVVSE